uniref:Cystatin-like n=1 Tax=Pogona vitticeps TaxID=103695 RepID=A0A6J0V6D0_9SAUR
MASSRWLLVCGAVLLGVALAAGQRALGAPIEASANDEGVQRALQFAINEYNRASNDKYVGRVSRIINVRKQIVSGVNYFLDVEVGRTTCTKPASDIENCAFHEAPALAQQVTCHFVVYHVPWLNSITLRKNNCH